MKFKSYYSIRRFIPAGTGNTWQRACRLLMGVVHAGTGNTRKQWRRWCISSVHPRWHREHSPADAQRSASFGSSPLARGTQEAESIGGEVIRFIPAGTGNTQQYKLHQNQPPGSSPLARGTLNVLAMANLQMRFIPAGTGNTVIRQMLDPQDAVHPRWHGEHQLAHGATTHLCGSSPLARGTHSTRRVGWQYRRFIPAGTGNTRLP